MKIKRLVPFGSLLILSLFGVLLLGSAEASAAAKTWNGDGTSTVNTGAKTITYNISDSANWVGGSAPVAGDSLIFPANQAIVDPSNSLTDDSNWVYKVNNDLSAGTSLAGIQFTGTPGSDCMTVFDDKYKLEGNALSLTGDIDNQFVTTGCTSNYYYEPSFNLALTATASIMVDINFNSGSLDFGSNNLSFCSTADSERLSTNASIWATLTGSGTVTFACGYNYVEATTNLTGNIVVWTSSSLYSGNTSLGDAVGKNVTVKDKAKLFLNYNQMGEKEFKRNIIFEGSVDNFQFCPYDYATCSADNTKYVSMPDYRLSVYNTGAYNETTETYPYYKVTLSGSVTLSADTYIHTSSDAVFTGAIAGSFKILPARGSHPGFLYLQSSNNGSLTPNGKYTAEKYVSTYDKDVSSSTRYISGNSKVYIASGIKAKNIIVLDGGIFLGAGTVEILTIKAGGTLAPGMSPGCLNSGNLIFQGGTYEVELGGTTACTEYDQMKVTGTVALGTDVTTLLASHFNSFKPAKDNTFTIIENDSTDAVTGTFKGLAEGATFTLDGYTYQVSYKGGDGNDVTLKVTTVPAVAVTAQAPNTGFKLIMANPLTVAVATFLAAGAVYYLFNNRLSTVKIKNRK